MRACMRLLCVPQVRTAAVLSACLKYRCESADPGVRNAASGNLVMRTVHHNSSAGRIGVRCTRAGMRIRPEPGERRDVEHAKVQLRTFPSLDGCVVILLHLQKIVRHLICQRCARVAASRGKVATTAAVTLTAPDVLLRRCAARSRRGASLPPPCGAATRAHCSAASRVGT